MMNLFSMKLSTSLNMPSDIAIKTFEKPIVKLNKNNIAVSNEFTLDSTDLNNTSKKTNQKHL